MSEGLPPITPAQVVDAAVRLTVRHGIDGWTVRALAQDLGVAQAVVYHHVGDRQQVVYAVASQVVDQIPVPAADRPWREWFGALLADVRKVTLHHPGVARHLVVLGPLAGAGRIVRPGMDVLTAAGFAEDAMMIYNYLSNTALSLIAVEDERNKDPDERMRRARELADLAQDPDEGLSEMGEWLASRAVSIDQLRAADAHNYRFSVERALDGAEARLKVVRKRTARRAVRLERRSTRATGSKLSTKGQE
ncbi:TetR family transcriptional regulator [Amycolatopsis minnesotensis]|uniref:TetR family transcriptional regulator n=1 Tax=Amycolatopsis minnesotensis TaxID=337894 RepID=A0ABN2QVM2_9PSEU